MDDTITREKIAYYVGNAFAVTWAGRSQLLRTAYNNNAPHEVISELVELPDQLYKNLNDVCDVLPHVAARA